MYTHHTLYTHSHAHAPQLFTSHDLDRVVSRVADVLNNTSNNWEMRVHAVGEGEGELVIIGCVPS